MNNLTLEIILGNTSFLLLFGIMLFYWIEINFSVFSKFHFINVLAAIFVNFTLLFLLLFRWSYYGHFPLSNMYESLIFLSWTLSLFQFYIEQLSKNIFIGAILSPIALFTNGVASFFLPQELQKASILVPALQSNWLMMHVTVMMLSYATLLVGSLLAIVFLIITFNTKVDLTENNLGIIDKSSGKIKSFDLDFINLDLVPDQVEKREKISSYNWNNKLTFASHLNANLIQITDSVQSNNNNFNVYGSSNLINNKLIKLLDNLSYRILGLGFPLLTIGILSGAVWANEAWGSYWSWDPKETWALITWLVFAIYLHTRITKGWQGKKPAIIALVGFFTIWVCYLGINLIGKGLHSYGWVQLNI